MRLQTTWSGGPRPPRARLDLRAGIRAHPLVAVLAAVVGCAVVYEAVLVFATPPNNWDSMSYHLSRAARWYQRHRVEYFTSHTERENAFQPNSEMEILYTFSFVGRDTAAATTQLLGELAMLRHLRLQPAARLRPARRSVRRPADCDADRDRPPVSHHPERPSRILVHRRGADERAAVWGMSRTEAQTLIRPDLLDTCQGVEHFVPSRARLGVGLSFDDWDYPLYSPTLQRRLVPVPQVNMLQFAERHHIHWVLLDRGALRPPPRATWNTVYFENSRWTMYLRPEELG